MQYVESLFRVASWVLLAISTIILMIAGFSNGITPAKIFGIINCVLFGIGGVYLIAAWLKG